MTPWDKETAHANNPASMGALEDNAWGGSKNSPPHYRAYLVRLWRDGETGPWRASVTHVVTAEVHKFASPQLLWAYLQRQLEEQPEKDNGNDLQ